MGKTTKTQRFQEAYREINRLQDKRKGNILRFVIAAAALFVLTFVQLYLIGSDVGISSNIIEVTYLTVSLIVMMFMAKQAIDHTRSGMQISSLEKTWGITRKEAKLYCQ